MKSHHLERPRPTGLLSLCFAVLLVLSASGAFAQERESKPRPELRTNRPTRTAPAPAPRSPVSTPAPSAKPAPSRGSEGSSHGRGYSRGRGGGHHWSFGLGYGGYGRYGHYGYGLYWPYHRYYRDYHYYPYYPWGLAWYPSYVGDTQVGAIDLEVKPKKAAVYVDGEYVGTAGKFDGFPGHLWLAEGSHQLVFHYDGRQTVARDVTVGYGPVRRLKLELADGPSVAPEELFAQREERVVAQRPAVESRPAAPRSRSASESSERSAAIDLRGEPGRFRVDVAPADATVYLDGRFLGSAEELSRLHSGMMVDAGEHYIEVQRPGFETERVEFTVAAGDEAQLSIDLDVREGETD